LLTAAWRPGSGKPRGRPDAFVGSCPARMIGSLLTAWALGFMKQLVNDVERML
jgi:hypothetical protein